MVQRRPFWPILTAVLIGLPVLYVASFGPVCWMCRFAHNHGWYESGGVAYQFLTWLYAPLLWLQLNGPAPIIRGLNWYGDML